MKKAWPYILVKERKINLNTFQFPSNKSAFIHQKRVSYAVSAVWFQHFNLLHAYLSAESCVVLISVGVLYVGPSPIRQLYGPSLSLSLSASLSSCHLHQHDKPLRVLQTTTFNAQEYTSHLSGFLFVLEFFSTLTYNLMT